MNRTSIDEGVCIYREAMLFHKKSGSPGTGISSVVALP